MAVPVGFLVLTGGVIAAGVADEGDLADLENIGVEAGTPSFFPTESDDVLLGWTNDDALDGLAGNDTLMSIDGEDTLSGGDGHDQLDGGADDDVLDGGNGTDLAIFAGSIFEADFSLSGGVATEITTADDGTDSLASIEFLQFDDFVVANANIFLDGAGNNYYNGITGGNDLIFDGGGHDKIKRAGGDDVFFSGAGNDRYWGFWTGAAGSDQDTAVFRGNMDDYDITSWTSSGRAVVRLTDSADGGADGLNEGTDRLYDIETIVFADQVVTFAELMT